MLKMDLHEIVKKLVGKINPIGETNTDNERFENLKVLCALVDNIIMDINEFSVKLASKYAEKFLREKVGITE